MNRGKKYVGKHRVGRGLMTMPGSSPIPLPGEQRRLKRAEDEARELEKLIAMLQ